MNPSQKKWGVAIVGMGNYATGQLIPALQQTAHCYLAGIVSGKTFKRGEWIEKYQLPGNNIYTYDHFDSIANNPDIDIVYVTLPVHLHAAFSIRAFQAGKHVICEKPMALTVAECDAMMAAAKKARKSLAIGYRLQFDPYHLEMIRLAKEKVYGEIKSIDTAFSFMPEAGGWRLNKSIAGGGPLMDVGIYCIQAVCYITGTTPLAVTAQSVRVSDDKKFIGIEETIHFQLEMPGGVTAKCRSSFSEEIGYLKVNCSNGWFELDPAYNFGGLKMTTSDGRKFEMHTISQQATQMDNMALSFQNNQPSIASGEMGKRDMIIMEAIYEAMTTGKRVELQTQA
jgi:predicted dehydrogenase